VFASIFEQFVKVGTAGTIEVGQAVWGEIEIAGRLKLALQGTLSVNVHVGFIAKL